MGSLLARAYKRILRGKLAQDEGEHWVTVNAGSKEGGEGGGSHVLLDGEGRVVAGMGGKFKGQNIDRIERKKFINQNAWNRQRKALIEKAGDDTQLKRVVTAGMRSQAEKEADKSNDTWQKEGLYNALVRRTQRENKGMINVLHDHLDHKNAQPKAVNPIAEKIQKQSDGIKQIVTEAITKYNDLEAVNQLNSVPDGVNVVTEKGQFFKTGDLWSSPDGKKTLENDQMFRLLKKELKAKQEAPKTEKTEREKTIEEVNNRHTFEIGGIIDRQSKGIERAINDSILPDSEKQKYLQRLNKLTDEALEEGSKSLDLYKVGTSYKKTNAEQKSFERTFDKLNEMDNLSHEINREINKLKLQQKRQVLVDNIEDATLYGAVYFKDNTTGKELFRANAKSKTWNVANEYNKDALEKAKSRQAKIDAGRPDHSVTVGTVTDNIRDAINQKGDLQSAYATLKDQIAGLKEGTYVVSYREGAVYRKTGNGLQYESRRFGWRDVDTKPEEFFKGNELHMGIGNTPEDAKANYKETEIMPMNHDYVASSVNAKLENSTRSNPRIDLGLALMNTLDDIPAGTFVKGKDGGPMYKKTTSGWVIPGLEYKPVVPDLRAFESKGDLTLGIGKTADEAKANTKTTELQALKKHDAEQLEKAEREKAEKAEREERSKDFYLNKIDKIKDSMNKGENYSSGLYKSELYKSLLLKANHGNTEEVNRVLNELKKEGIYTDKHRIWGLADVAKQNADYIAERHEKADKTTTTLKGATVNKEVYNGEARISVKFDKIPNYATRVALKQNGFKWNADAGEWYKSEGENGTAHENIVNTLKDQGFNEQPKNEAPTAQPSQATPKAEDQPRSIKNVFSDKYQKIDNSNLNKYQEVDNISNNKNTENGVTNMTEAEKDQKFAQEKRAREEGYARELMAKYRKEGIEALQKAGRGSVVLIDGKLFTQYRGDDWSDSLEGKSYTTAQIADMLDGQASKADAQPNQATAETKTTGMSIKDYEGKANINPRVATYIEDMGLKLSKDQYDKIATDYPPGNRSGDAFALVGRDMRALQAFTKEYAKEISNTIADQETAFKNVEGKHDFKGGSITINKGDYLGITQQASISFTGKPSEETRALLKKNGFTYYPRSKTWENTEKLGSNKHEKLLQALKDGVTIESTQQATPTAQPSQATPTQQAEGKQYHGTGIENKNGRYEVSFNEFPSYKLRTDMKANGFRWDPNAKVWHTTDREKLDKVMSKHFTERT